MSRVQAKAEAKAARAEAKAAAKAVKDEAKAAAQLAQAEASSDEIETRGDEVTNARTEAEEKAAMKLERQAAAQTKHEVRETVRVAPESPTELEGDEGGGTEHALAVAGRMLRDTEDAQLEQDEARQAAKEQATQAKQTANEAKQTAKAEAAEAKAAARREREVAKAEVKAEAREAKATHRADDDHIVEAPREPKKSLLDRLRPTPANASAEADGEAAPSSLIPTLAVVLGALGFVFSVVLAIGAFMVALNPQGDGGLFSVVSNICDALVGPLRGLFSFSGVNGESKDALVAWGLGALGYLILGLFAQSFLRARGEDD